MVKVDLGNNLHQTDRSDAIVGIEIDSSINFYTPNLLSIELDETQSFSPGKRFWLIFVTVCLFLVKIFFHKQYCFFFFFFHCHKS